MDERPLNLRDLADVESPEVLRAALRRFRRRTIWRVLGIILLVLALPTFFVGLSEQRRGPTEAEVEARAPSVRVDRVVEGRHTTVLLLEIKDYTDAIEKGQQIPNFVFGSHTLRLVGYSADVSENERLAITTLPIGPVDDDAPYDGPAKEVTESMIEFDPTGIGSPPGHGGQRTIELFVLALTGRTESRGRGPGSHTREECSYMNSFNVCELLKIEGRIIERIKIAVSSLPMPEPTS